MHSIWITLYLAVSILFDFIHVPFNVPISMYYTQMTRIIIDPCSMSLLISYIWSPPRAFWGLLHSLWMTMLERSRATLHRNEW